MHAHKLYPRADTHIDKHTLIYMNANPNSMSRHSYTRTHTRPYERMHTLWTSPKGWVVSTNLEIDEVITCALFSMDTPWNKSRKMHAYTYQVEDLPECACFTIRNPTSWVILSSREVLLTHLQLLRSSDLSPLIYKIRFFTPSTYKIVWFLHIRRFDCGFADEARIRGG